MESAPITNQETLFPKTVQIMRCNAGKKRGKLGENDIDVAHRQGYFFEQNGQLQIACDEFLSARGCLSGTVRTWDSTAVLHCNSYHHVENSDVQRSILHDSRGSFINTDPEKSKPQFEALAEI